MYIESFSQSISLLFGLYRSISVYLGLLFWSILGSINLSWTISCYFRLSVAIFGYFGPTPHPLDGGKVYFHCIFQLFFEAYTTRIHKKKSKNPPNNSQKIQSQDLIFFTKKPQYYSPPPIFFFELVLTPTYTGLRIAQHT